MKIAIAEALFAENEEILAEDCSVTNTTECLISEKVISDRTCKNGSELHQWRFRLDIRKNFFTKRMVKHRNSLSREVANAPSLSVFNRHLDNAVNNML